MASNTREIKRRIKSVGNIRQITKAMQLVATSKMKRAQRRSLDSDAYAYGVLEILENVTRSSEGTGEHPYWKEHTAQKVGLLLISADRGFCGGLNVLLFNKVLDFIKKKEEEGNTVAVVTVGKKGRNFVKKLGMPIIADFTPGDHFMIQEIGPIARIATEDFLRLQYKAIYLAYNQFVNTLRQVPIVRRILPIDIATFKEIAALDVKMEKFSLREQEEKQAPARYLFEPSIEAVFGTIIPYLLEVEIYKALLESLASEHSSRMIAMKNETDKAGELIGYLRLVYNQARQASITKEIAEISSGAMTS